MTTIVWDGRTLATDSQANCGAHKSGGYVKKLFKNVGAFRAVALSGEVRGFPVVLDALAKGQAPEHGPTYEISGVAVAEDGVAWEFDADSWIFQRMKAPAAQGSGWALATAAMRGGADAVSALRITCELDLYSGGRIQRFSLESDA